MSSLIVEAVKISAINPHGNADKLEIAICKGWQCIVPKDRYKAGDLVIYIPIDGVIPQPLSDKLEITKYLSKQRVKTAKLRGIISQGVIVSANEVPGVQEGQDVSTILGVTKWEPPAPGLCTGGTPRPQHPDFLRYTDIEAFKNYPDVLIDGEEVVVTEKIHGCLRWDTPITMKGGKTQCIMDVKGGDIVVSYNVNRRRFEERRVLRAIMRPPSKRCRWLRIILEDGNTLEITADHRIKTPNGWKRAGTLSIGEEVVSINN